MKVNTRLRVLRAERGLSQMDTAIKAGLALNRYWRIENGYSEATAEEKAALAKAFGVPVNDAFTEAIAS